jgi:uncharacterized protein (DUF924 family)
MTTEPGRTPADEASAAAYAALDPRARAVLDCWFGTPDAPEFNTDRALWFKRDERFDAMLGSRFGTLIDAGIAGGLDVWQARPLGALALVVVLDQFSRNCYRNTARAFAGDPAALEIAQRMVASGADRALPTDYHRAFAYLPFEHDESRASQQESLRLYRQLQTQPMAAEYYRSAERHAQIIERFGRYPHRNAVLGRVSTDDEIEFLSKPGSSF